MNSKQIAIKYLAPKLEDPKDIFLNEEIFKLVLFWARESAREFFATQITKMFLVHYVDDIGPIVDEYLFCRAKKMYKDAMKKKNSLFNSLYSSEKIIIWIISRYINIFISLSTNTKYREYIDIINMRVNFDENIGFYSSNIEEKIELEKIKKLPKKQIKKALQNVWEDSKYDFDFHIDKFDELCKMFSLKSKNVIKRGTLLELDLTKEQIKSKHYQVIINFN